MTEAAFQIPGDDVGVLTAAADLSGAQFRAVKIDANGQVALAGDGEVFDGILQNKPALGEVAHVMTSGVSKIIGSDANPASTGDLIASDANGKLRTAGVGDETGGRCVAGTSTDLLGSAILGYKGVIPAP